MPAEHRAEIAPAISDRLDRLTGNGNRPVHDLLAAEPLVKETRRIAAHDPDQRRTVTRCLKSLEQRAHQRAADARALQIGQHVERVDFAGVIDRAVALRAAIAEADDADMRMLRHPDVFRPVAEETGPR